ncbi:MAG: hypothetical protein JRC66_08315 [Deltaproteobacteria bacterium]|nr:hypothetical protein [Deltaproteobacteria bacterium]
MTKKQTAIPFDLYAEESIIGTIIENNNALKQAARLLAPEDFWDEGTAMVFNTCIRLFDKGEKVDKNLVVNTLREEETLEDIGGEDYISKLIKSADAVSFSSNVSKIKAQGVLRELMAMANKTLKDISKENPDVNAILQEIRAGIASLEARMDGLPPRIVGLEIATTNPRSYRMKFSNGEEVPIGIEDLLKVSRVKQIITNVLDFVPALPKDWEKFVRMLMQTASRRPTSGVDLTGDVLDVIRDLFEARGEAKAASDLRTGSYARDVINGKEYYLFQKRAVVEYIKQQLKKDMDTVQLWRMFQQWGGIDNKDGKPIFKRIGNDSRTGLWGLPSLLIESGEVEVESSDIFKNGEVDTSFLD